MRIPLPRIVLALSLVDVACSAPLPVSNTVYDVFGELRVLTEGVTIRIAKNEMPPELAGAASKVFGDDVRTVLAQRRFSPGSDAANLFLEVFAKKGLIAPAATDQTGCQLYLAVHDFGFASRVGPRGARSGEDLVPLVSNTGQPTALVGGSDTLKAKRSPLFYPAVRVSVDLANERHQLVWSRTATVAHGHPALAGLTAAQLLGDDQQVRASLKAVLALAAEDLANALAAQLAMKSELAPLTPVLELTANQRGADGFTVKEPAVARPVAPHYAPALREAGITGLAFVEVEVGEDGRVAKIIGAGGVPENLFNEAAMLAVRMWRYQPAVFDGKPARYRTTQMVTFKPSQRE